MNFDVLRYDAVTYLKYLDTLRVSEGVRSVWIFADSSHKIFEYAKKRVFQLVTSEGGKVAVDRKNAANKKRKVKEDNKDAKEGDCCCNGCLFIFIKFGFERF